MHRTTPRLSRGAASRSLLALWAFGLACVLVPSLFFYGTWYGVRLDDAQLSAYLEPGASPDHVRHALEEITRRFQGGDPGMERWSDALVGVSRREDPSLRLAAAWAMQYDATRPEFVARLEELLTDDAFVVRCNAATSLAAGGSAAGRAVLRTMIEPFTVAAPASGEVVSVASVDERVQAGRPLARLRLDGGDEAEVRAPLSGHVRRTLVEKGGAVTQGASLVEVAPEAAQVGNAAKALLLVGTAEDVPLLQALADPRSGLPQDVQAEARAAVDAIRAR